MWNLHLLTPFLIPAARFFSNARSSPRWQWPFSRTSASPNVGCRILTVLHILMVTWIISIPQMLAYQHHGSYGLSLRPPFFLLTISIHHLFDAFLVWNPLKRVQLIAIPGCEIKWEQTGTQKGSTSLRACLTHHRYMNGESIRIDAGIRMGKLWWAGVWPPVVKIARRSDVAAGASEDFNAPTLEKDGGSWNHVRFTIPKGIHRV